MSEQIPQELFEQAQRVLPNVYAPYSKFHVACCLRAEDGTLFAGVNVENASYSITTCAEESALAALISSGRKHIKEALILIDGDQLCPPCGACRQRLFEFADQNTKVHLCTLNNKHKTITVGELLPYPFGSDLLETT